jgi:LacI family transcriptional regulator
MVTIKDIARMVGVSSSTVARALNDSPKISEATKIRVRAAARQLGYVAHSAARLMRGETSTVIGLTVPDVENDFYATLARAVAEVCRESGFQLVLSITEDEPSIEYEHLRALVGAQAAGAVIVPTSASSPASRELLERLPSVQLIRHLPALESDSFAIDDERGIRDATRHLIDLGHTRIAYIGAASTLSTGQDRVKDTARRSPTRASTSGRNSSSSASRAPRLRATLSAKCTRPSARPRWSAAAARSPSASCRPSPTPASRSRASFRSSPTTIPRSTRAGIRR